MSWFSIGDRVKWENKKGITMNGEVVAILEPGEIAEDVLDENERTRISTKNLRATITPETRRALIKVKDEHGWITYHTIRLGMLEMKEEQQEVTIEDMWNLLNEMKKLLEQKTGNARLRTVGK